MPKQRVLRTRTSARKDWHRCQQRWWWAWVDGMRKPGPPAVALWFGQGWHEVMAHIYKGPGYKRGRKPLKIWRDFCDTELDQFVRIYPNVLVDEVKYVNAKALGESMLGQYLDIYQMDPHWWIIESECTFAFPLGHGRIYNGKFDLVRRDERLDQILLEEHKTAKAIRTGYLQKDRQTGGYWAVADNTLRAQGKIGPKERLQGIEYNFARKALPDGRPRDAKGLYLNKDGSISKVQPPPHFLRHTALRTPRERTAMLRHVWDEMDQMDDVISGKRQATKNPTVDCDWDCIFSDMCELHEAGADWREYADMMFVRQDPFADHRKSAGE
jgi:hypothetical protein